MFKNGWAGSWLLIGLVGSVLLRSALWVLSVTIVGPLLGPVAVLLLTAVDRQIGTAIWFGEIVVAFLLAAATGAACWGLRDDRAWAYRLGRGLAWCYVVCNVTTAIVCGVLLPGWSQMLAPFVVYVVSTAVAILALRQLRAHRESPTVVGLTALRHQPPQITP